MVRIVTQSEAQERRRAVTFCYLCGRDLTDGDKTTREHIVPRAVLGTQPSPAWAVVLDVHENCERRDKRGSDALFALWSRLFLPPEERAARALEVIDEFFDSAKPTDAEARKRVGLATVRLAAACGSTVGALEIRAALDEYVDVLGAATDVPSRDTSRVKMYLAALFDPKRHLNLGHYRSTPFKVVEGIAADECHLPLDGFGDVMAAVWTWVRGLHALLYGSFLANPTPHVVLTPLPVFSGTTSPRPFADARVHRTILAALDVASQANKLDRVQDWDRRCDFRCAWVHLPEAKAFARGTWRLDVTGPPDVRSWWGWYDLPVPPKGTDVLTQSDFDRYSDRPQVH